jgi:hypothetical protein
MTNNTQSYESPMTKELWIYSKQRPDFLESCIMWIKTDKTVKGYFAHDKKHSWVEFDLITMQALDQKIWPGISCQFKPMLKNHGAESKPLATQKNEHAPISTDRIPWQFSHEKIMPDTTINHHVGTIDKELNVIKLDKIENGFANITFNGQVIAMWYKLGKKSDFYLRDINNPQIEEVKYDNDNILPIQAALMHLQHKLKVLDNLESTLKNGSLIIGNVTVFCLAKTREKFEFLVNVMGNGQLISCSDKGNVDLSGTRYQIKQNMTVPIPVDKLFFDKIAIAWSANSPSPKIETPMPEVLPVVGYNVFNENNELIGYLGELHESDTQISGSIGRHDMFFSATTLKGLFGNTHHLEKIGHETLPVVETLPEVLPVAKLPVVDCPFISWDKFKEHHGIWADLTKLVDWSNMESVYNRSFEFLMADSHNGTHYILFVGKMLAITESDYRLIKQFDIHEATRTAELFNDNGRCFAKGLQFEAVFDSKGKFTGHKVLSNDKWLKFNARNERKTANEVVKLYIRKDITTRDNYIQKSRNRLGELIDHMVVNGQDIAIETLPVELPKIETHGIVASQAIDIMDMVELPDNDQLPDTETVAIAPMPVVETLPELPVLTLPLSITRLENDGYVLYSQYKNGALIFSMDSYGHSTSDVDKAKIYPNAVFANKQAQKQKLKVVSLRNIKKIDGFWFLDWHVETMITDLVETKESPMPVETLPVSIVPSKPKTVDLSSLINMVKAYVKGGLTIRRACEVVEKMATESDYQALLSHFELSDWPPVVVELPKVDSAPTHKEIREMAKEKMKEKLEAKRTAFLREGGGEYLQANAEYLQAKADFDQAWRNTPQIETPKVESAPIAHVAPADSPKLAHILPIPFVNLKIERNKTIQNPRMYCFNIMSNDELIGSITKFLGTWEVSIKDKASQSFASMSQAEGYVMGLMA